MKGITMSILANYPTFTYKIDDLFDQLGVKYPLLGVTPTHVGTLLPAPGNQGHGTQVGRNSTLTSIAGAMRRKGLGEAAIAAALQTHNQTVFQTPLPEYEVARIAKSIANYPVPTQAQSLLHTLDDIGNVRRLLGLYGEDIRFIPELGKWAYWNGQRWIQDEHGEQIMDFAKAVPAAIDMEAGFAFLMQGVADPGALEKAMRKHARSSSMLNKLNAIIALAGLDKDVSLPLGNWDSNKMLLGVANGVIDLHTGKFRPNRKEDYITRFSPVAYDPKATCSEWHKFLNRITGFSGLPRRNKAERQRVKAYTYYLKRVVGYGLTGRTDEQVLFFLHGHGANGKTVFMTTLEHLLGTRLSAQTPSETLMATKQQSKSTNDLARLARIRVVLSNEMEDGILDEPMVKQMTGGDTITCRFLYGEFFQFTPEFKLFISGNHKPVIRNQDHGIWRRIQLIPFTVTIPKEDQDSRLDEKLRAEAPGILNWAIKGCIGWQRQGLNAPEIITQAVQEYRAEMDLLGQWLEEECTLGANLSCRASEAYGVTEFSAYRGWCGKNGVRPLSSKAFGRKLEERGFGKGRDACGVIYHGFYVRKEQGGHHD